SPHTNFARAFPQHALFQLFLSPVFCGAYVATISVRCKYCLVHIAVTIARATFALGPPTLHCLTMDKITGIHAVREALQAGRALEHVLIAKGRQDTRIEEIVQLARQNSIPVRFEDRGQLDRSAGTRDHQGVVAIAAARTASSFEDIVA